MSRQMGGRGSGGNGDVVRSAGFAAAKGAALIGLAVIIGVVLLHRVDDGETGSAATPERTSTTTTVATDDTTASTTPPTTVAPQDERPPAEVRVLVLNGGAASGSAKTMNDALKQKGYTNVEEPNTWSNHAQEGNTVLCRPGLERDAAALAIAVGTNTKTDVFPDPAPPFSDQAECVVVVGS